MKNISVTILMSIVLFSVYAQNKKVLIVSTNVSVIDNSANGTFLMEIAYPLQHFADAGYDVDIVTAKGGKAAIYHNESYFSKEVNRELAEIQASKVFSQKVENSLSPTQIKPGEYAGIYYPGGGGQFYDVVNNPAVSSIAASIYENGGVVGAAGHGPASLINIRLSDSTHLVRNKKITCYPKAWSAKWIPIDWEKILKERGADVVLPVTAAEKKEGIQITDAKARVITGSYAENAKWVAKQMVILMKGK